MHIYIYFVHSMTSDTEESCSSKNTNFYHQHLITTQTKLHEVLYTRQAPCQLNVINQKKKKSSR